MSVKTALLSGRFSFSGSRRKFAALSAGVAVVAAFLYSFDPSTAEIYAPCPFHALTGLYCPGCGTLRALHELLHGDFVAAIAYNPLAMGLLWYPVYAFLAFGVRAFGGRDLPQPFRSARSGWVILGGIVAYWVLRNVPVFPFTFLAPAGGLGG